jgi:LmbE family N-acetylglucosaminyl deacetylase
MKVVVVSAHPDDMEMSCSGFLLRLQQQGADITSVITVKPSAEIHAGRSQRVVQDELEASYALSKFDLRVFDTPLHSNGRPNLVVDNNTMTQLSKLLDSCDLAIIPNADDYHQDHRSTFHLSYPLLIARAREIWSMHSVPYCYHNQATCDITADISDHWKIKSQLIGCYSSYVGVDLIQKIELSNRYWAGKINTQYAEQFKTIHRSV